MEYYEVPRTIAEELMDNQSSQVNFNCPECPRKYYLKLSKVDEFTPHIMCECGHKFLWST